MIQTPKLNPAIANIRMAGVAARLLGFDLPRKEVPA